MDIHGKPQPVQCLQHAKNVAKQQEPPWDIIGKQPLVQKQKFAKYVRQQKAPQMDTVGLTETVLHQKLVVCVIKWMVKPFISTKTADVPYVVAESQVAACLSTSIRGGYYLLTTGSCSSTDIVIPTTYRGLPVLGIYKDFSTRTNNSDCAINSDSITSIYIPSCITDIGARVFLNCSNLTSIVYDGTKQQWNAITKGEHWYSAFSTIVVTCNDGTLTYS